MHLLSRCIPWQSTQIIFHDVFDRAAYLDGTKDQQQRYGITLPSGVQTKNYCYFLGRTNDQWINRLRPCSGASIMICGRKHLLSMTGRSWSLLLVTFLLIDVSKSEVEADPTLATVVSVNEMHERKNLKFDFLKPSPNHSPGDVIRIQLQALADNDHPYENAGIEVTFRFASPANKSATGPLERFIRMVQSPAYRPMLNHKAASYGELRIEGNQAAQAVVLTTSSGERVGYVFILSKQEEGICDECWMTDGVLRFEVGEELREI